ncbi:MAG: hypothetical protein ACKUBY_02145 [Candidatus Moraniibacteriota bacterium]|jgi:hypothetical protein
MFDKIEKKVEEVRQQPEEIRIRYVWGSVAITMFFVIFIWLLSMKINFLQVSNTNESTEAVEDLQRRIDTLNNGGISPDQAISIDELLQQNSAE